MKVKFSVEGMSCAACSASVERVSKRVEGVTNAEVNLLAKTLVVECEKDTPELRQKICTAVEKAGFTAAPADQKAEEAAVIKEDKKKEKSEAENMKRRLIASVAILAVLMYLTMGHMVGLPVPRIFHGTENLVVFAFTQLLLTLPIVYLNRKFYIVGFKALWNRSPNMDSLVAVGSAAALIYGVFAIYMIGYGLGHGDLELAKTYGSNLYFESAAMILTLVSVGKFLEERSKNKTGAAVEHLMKLAPDTAIVEKNGVQVEVKTSALQVGDIIIVKPGQSLPADGTIVEGSSSIDESALTGESIPVEKTVGSRVMTASINKTGSFKFRARENHRPRAGRGRDQSAYREARRQGQRHFRPGRHVDRGGYAHRLAHPRAELRFRPVARYLGARHLLPVRARTRYACRGHRLGRAAR